MSISNPPAPYTPREMRSERMTNSDFRKLMMTPRSNSDHDNSFATPMKRSAKDAGMADDERAKKKAMAAAHWRKKMKEKEEKEKGEGESAAKYRDRAAERRMGQNLDYEESEKELRATVTLSADGGIRPSATPAGVTPIPPVIGKKELETEDFLRTLSVEKSKYLGGDEEHTHLVKGLDFALLAKVKSEMVHEEEKKKMEVKEKEKRAEEKEGEVHFHTPLSRSLYTYLFQSAPRVHSDKFLRGRSTYLFDTSEDGLSVTPMTIIQSHIGEETEGEGDHIYAPINPKIMDQLGRISAYLKGADSKKRKGRKLAHGQTQTMHSAREGPKEKEDKRKGEEEEERGRDLPSFSIKNVEDSIFGDIGEYVLKVETEKPLPPPPPSHFPPLSPSFVPPPPPPPSSSSQYFSHFAAEGEGEDMDMDTEDGAGAGASGGAGSIQETIEYWSHAQRGLTSHPIPPSSSLTSAPPSLPSGLLPLPSSQSYPLPHAGVTYPPSYHRLPQDIAPPQPQFGDRSTIQSGQRDVDQREKDPSFVSDSYSEVEAFVII